MTIGTKSDGAWTVSWLGADYTILVDRSESGGGVGLFESVVPAGEGPPLHIHHHEDEIIHVIDGEYEFWRDGATRRLRRGEAIFLPRGVPHTFRVVGTRPGRNLAVVTPGGFEGFFGEVAALDPGRAGDAPMLQAICRRYGLEFLGSAAWAD